MKLIDLDTNMQPDMAMSEVQKQAMETVIDGRERVAQWKPTKEGFQKEQRHGDEVQTIPQNFQS